MNVIITGSEGYLGCNLWDEMDHAGHNLMGVDRCLYGKRYHDTDDSGIGYDKADAVVNLAALVGEPVCIANPRLTGDYNVTYAVRQAERAIKYKAKVFVQISTCSVYGERGADELVTVDTPITDDPLPPYAASKVQVERALMGLEWGSTLPRIVRLGTLCGPSRRMRFDLMANGFCLAAGRNKRVVIYNPGSVRPHVSVGSVSRMLRYVVEHPEDCAPLMVYVGGQHTVEELAYIAARTDAIPAAVVVDKTKAIDDRRSYRVKCSDELMHIDDCVPMAMHDVTKACADYRWAGADPASKAWGNTGWRFER